MGFELEFSATVIREMSLEVISIGKFIFIVSLALKHHLLGYFSVFIAHSRITPLFTSFLPRCEIRKYLFF